MNIGMGKNLFEVLQNCGICMCNKVCRSSSLNGINKNLVARTLLRIMGWEIVYLDILLVPLSILILLSYQCFLVWRVRNKPLQTVIGVNHLARKQWVFGIMKVWLYIYSSFWHTRILCNLQSFCHFMITYTWCISHVMKNSLHLSSAYA